MEVSAEHDDLLAVDLSHLLAVLPLLPLLSELVPLLVAVLVPLLQSHYVVVFVPEFQTHLVHLFQVQVLGGNYFFYGQAICI